MSGSYRMSTVQGSPKELWVHVYQYEDGKELAVNKGHHGPVRCIDISPKGNSYASGTTRYDQYSSLVA